MLGLAVLGLISLGSAARNWTSIWQGLDQLTMSLESVQVARDYSTITVTTTLTNQSDEVLWIHEMDTGVRLTGRSIAAVDERFDQLQLGPGESIRHDAVLPVTRPEAAALEERLAGGGERWNINGRVSVAVTDLSEPIWWPFRFDMDVE